MSKKSDGDESVQRITNNILLDNLRDRIAKEQHDEIWSHWHKYVVSVSIKNDDGSITIPSEHAQRWERQMNTSYEDLSKKEQKSDIEQADKIIKIIKEYNDLI